MYRKLKQLQEKKFFIRPRIIRLFQKTENKSLVEVTADAGYGKTQSVLSYVSDIDAHVVWVSLKPLDNYTGYFWDSFCDSLDIINHELAKEFKERGFPEDYPSLYRFINAFVEEIYRDMRFILVFDDYHILTHSTILNFIHNIISMDLENMTVFLLSRTDLYFPKNSSKNKESAFKITNEHLAFTLSEVNDYILKSNIALPYRVIKDVYQKTEGWPIAVCLTALSIKENPQTGYMLEQSIKSLIYNIIETEIFSKHSLDKQIILVKLSFFESFSIQFIENLTSIIPEEVMVSLLSNLLIRYNPHTQSYQFHQLFRNFLKEKMFLLNEQEIRETYQIAGEWFKKLKLNAAALDCYLKLNDYDALWSILLNTLSNGGRISADTGREIMKIIHIFPQSFIQQNPLIRIIYGLGYSWRGDFAKAILEFKKITDEFECMEKNEHVKATIGEAYVFMGLHYMLFGNLLFIECFKKAYKYLPQGSNLLGKRWMILSTGASITLKDGSPHEMEKWVRTLEETAPYLEHLLNKNTYGLEFIAKAEAAYYQCDFTNAEKYAYQAIYCGKEENLADIVCNSYFLLTKIAIAKGEYQKNLGLLDLSKEYSEKYNTESHYNIPEIAEGYFYIKIEQLDRMPDWITNGQEYNNKDSIVCLGVDQIIIANYMLIQEKLYELIPYLDKAERLYKVGNQTIALIHIYILKAITYQGLGDDERLSAAFLHAYNMSHENNIIMPFIEYGRYMRTLIQYIRNNLNYSISDRWLMAVYSKATTYAKRLKHICNQYENEHLSFNEENILSKAETNILIALSQGLTREEIAENTNISLNTVKSQIKSIYSKLGAINGMHAVRIAITKGIIQGSK